MFPLAAFRFAVDYTREDTSLLFCGNLSTLSSSILPPFLPATGTIRQKRLPLFFDDVPFVRDIVLFRVSNFKRYYSSFRETPSRILDLRRRVFPVRRPDIILLFILPFDFRGVTWGATR